VLIAWAGLVGAVAAQPTETALERSFSLSYRVSASCPDAATLAAAIQTRTPGAVWLSADQAAVQLRIELGQGGPDMFWITLPEGTSRRELPQAACVDTVASIAVIASMVLEADVSERAATTKSFMDGETADEPPAAPREPEPAALSVRPSAPAAVAAPGRPARRPPSSRQRESRLRFAIAAGGLVESAVASSAAWGASIGVTALWDRAESVVWSPRATLEGFATLPATEHAGALGDVELRVAAARLHLCPLQLPLTRSFRLVPCATGDLGNLWASGAGKTLNPHQKTMLWPALGGTVRAQLALGRWVSLESSLALRGLLRHDLFVFEAVDGSGTPVDPDFPAYQVPAWSVGAGVGLSVALP
jgi:hypothetical protein